MEPIEDRIPLLRKAVEWVEEQEQLPATQRQWHQKHWRVNSDSCLYLSSGEEASAAVSHCGTVCCVAGYLGGILDERYEKSIYAVQEGDLPNEPTHVAHYVADALGITRTRFPNEGHLFYPQNTAADVRRIAEEIAGEPL